MDSFLLCLILTFIIALGGREQLIVAQFSQRLGRTLPLLVTGGIAACASAGVMAWLGFSMAALLPPRAADMLVAFALGIAAFELAWPVRVKPMKEPTRSLVAIGIVLFFRQVGDAARFAVFALAAEATYPATALAGGTLGSVLAVGLGWFAGAATLERYPLRAVRLCLGLCMILAALVIGLNARYQFL